MDRAPAYDWISSARTDVGMVRKVNEDACLSRDDAGLWVVADGMGGHAAGDVASGRIIAELSAIEAHEDISAAVTEIEARLMRVNDELRELASSRNLSTIGSTVAALLLGRRHGMCLWVGDSRIYRIRDGVIQQLTQDHAFVEDLVEKGILSREDAASHPQSNLVTRAVGAQEQLKLDVEIFDLANDDVFVMCSDGLDKEVSENEIAITALREAPERLGDELVELALSRGARDNVTVVAVTVRDANAATRPRPPAETLSAQVRELQLAPDDGDVDDDEPAVTDFGRLARHKKPPAPLMLDDEDVTIPRSRRDDRAPDD